MSRIANAPIPLPDGVDVRIDGRVLSVKGSKGALDHRLHPSVEVEQADGHLRFSPRDDAQESVAQTGTARAVVANMVTGVKDGFERRLTLVGVGYRAQMQGQSLNLALGYSHPIAYEPPAGISLETPTQTEVVVRGIDKQQVGQVAAIIRGYRPPEPYKGKGVRYSDEAVRRKEAKKK